MERARGAPGGDGARRAAWRREPGGATSTATLAAGASSALPTSGPATPVGAFDAARVLRRAVVLVALGLLVMVLVLWLPAFEPVRDRFGQTEGRWVLVAAALQVGSVLSFNVAMRGAFDRRIGWRAALDLGAVEQGANVVLPSGGSGGLAIGAVLLVRAGVPAAFAAGRSAVLFLATSAASFLAVVVAGAGEALGVLPGDAATAATLGPAAGAALVLVAVPLLALRLPKIRSDPARRVRSAISRAEGILRNAVRTTIALAQCRDPLLIGGAVGYLVFDVASLGAAFAALGGGGLPAGTFTLAYVLGHAGALIPLPGSAEGGLVGTFTAYGSPLSLTVGAVLLYRTFHAGVPILLGLTGYADIRQLRRRSPSPQEIAARFPDGRLA